MRNIGAFKTIEIPKGASNDPHLLYTAAKNLIENDGGTVVNNSCLFETVKKISCKGDLTEFSNTLLPAYKTDTNGGYLYLYEKPSFNNENGRIIINNFTRANSAEDAAESGATVIDADGTIRKLLEDEAPWSYSEGGESQGCVMLAQEPSKKNRVLTPESEPISNNVTITDAGSFGDVKLWQIDFPDISGDIARAEFDLDSFITGDFFVSIYVNCPANEDFLLGFSISSSDSEIFTGDGEIKRFSTKQTASSNNKIRITRRDTYTNTNPVTIYIAAPQVEAAGDYTKPTSYIPANVTRNNFIHPLNDLINKGVFGSFSGCVFVELQDVIFDETTNNVNFLTLGTKTTEDYLRLRGDETNSIFQISGFGVSENISVGSPKKILITWDNKIVKIFAEGAKKGEQTTIESVDIYAVFERNQAPRPIKTINKIKNLGFAPYAIPEAEAIALTQ